MRKFKQSQFLHFHHCHCHSTYRGARKQSQFLHFHHCHCHSTYRGAREVYSVPCHFNRLSVAKSKASVPKMKGCTLMSVAPLEYAFSHKTGYVQTDVLVLARTRLAIFTSDVLVPAPTKLAIFTSDVLVLARTRLAIFTSDVLVLLVENWNIRRSSSCQIKNKTTTTTTHLLSQ